MPRFIFLFFACLQFSSAQSDGAVLVKQLRSLYEQWRSAVIRKDANDWLRATASHRQQEIKNRILSERKRFPQAFFNLPAKPPSLAGLKALRVRIKGPTVKAVYYGKVDFGVGGKPIDSLFTVSYVKEVTGWKYDGSEFVNIGALPAIKKELDAGKLDYVDQADFKPTGVIPPLPQLQLVSPVKYIAKTYVFCPGREVNLTVNGYSKHQFQHDKASQVVIGGAREGENEISYQIKPMEGGDPKAPMTIRVYLMSQVNGQKPVKVFEYQVDDGSTPKESGTGTFTVTPEIAKQLR